MSFTDDLKKDWCKPPNILTEIRILLCWLPAALLLVGYFDQDVSRQYFCWYSVVAFAAVALTDFIDGKMARRMNMVTELGTILDPVVDKFLVGFTMLALMVIQPMTIVPFAIMLAREAYVAITLNRARHDGKNPRVITSGKIKMWAQCIVVLCFMLPFSAYWWTWVEWTFMGIALVLTITSGFEYYRAFKEIR